MTSSNREDAAIIVFLEQMSTERALRKRLAERASEEPHKVIAYLDSLPKGVEEQDELSQWLRSIATAALKGQIVLY